MNFGRWQRVTVYPNLMSLNQQAEEWEPQDQGQSIINRKLSGKMLAILKWQTCLTLIMLIPWMALLQKDNECLLCHITSSHKCMLCHKYMPQMHATRSCYAIMRIYHVMANQPGEVLSSHVVHMLSWYRYSNRAKRAVLGPTCSSQLSFVILFD